MNIGFNEAKKFLDNLKPEDDVCLIIDGDLDGFASGVLLYDWCEKKGLENIKVKFFCGGFFVGEDHKKCNKVILADVNPTGFGMLKYPREQEVLYLDHHPRKDKLTPPNVLEYRTTDEGYIPSSRTVQELTGLKEWLGVCGVLGDSGDLYPENNDYINKFLEEKGITLGEYKVGVANVISNSISYFKDDLISFFYLLKEKDSPEECDDLRKYSDVIDAEIQKSLNYCLENKKSRGKLSYCFMPSRLKHKSITINLLSRKHPEDVFIMVGSTDKMDFYSMSLRHQSEDYDVIKIASYLVEGLSESVAGGHKRAAGGRFKREDLQKVKKRIEELSLEMFK